MSMINARAELGLRIDARNKTVAYGYVEWAPDFNEDEPKVSVSFKNHAEFLKALVSLDFEYDNGYGGQELFGIIVFTDGTWLTRGEYDGSEWWAYHACPTMEQVFKK